MASKSPFPIPTFPASARLQSYVFSNLTIAFTLILGIGSVVVFRRAGRKNEGHEKDIEPPEVDQGFHCLDD